MSKENNNTLKTRAMKATYIYNEGFNTLRKLANRCLKAFSDIQEYDNGTIRNPCELASSYMKDGRTLIQTIYEDGEVDYNDGWYVVEVNEFHIYVDFTGIAATQMFGENGKYDYIISLGLEEME